MGCYRVKQLWWCCVLDKSSTSASVCCGPPLCSSQWDEGQAAAWWGKRLRSSLPVWMRSSAVGWSKRSSKMFIDWFLTGFVPSFSYLKNTVCCDFSSVAFMVLIPEKPMVYHETCPSPLFSGTATRQFLKILNVAKGMTPDRKGGLLWRKGKAGEDQTTYI